MRLFKRIFNDQMVAYAIIALIIVYVLFTIFTVELPGLKYLPDYAARMILVFVGVGLLFFILGNNRLMLSSFIAAAVFSLYLKNFSNDHIGQFPKVEKGLVVANNYLLKVKSSLPAFIREVQSSQADMICLQKVNEDWARILKNFLKTYYPNQTEIILIDSFGKMVFSILPILNVDTFSFRGLPSFGLKLDLNDDDCRLLCTQMVHPYQSFRGLFSSKHLMFLSDYIRQIDNPINLAGKFSQVYWSRDLRALLENTGLLNSRKYVATIGSRVPYGYNIYPKDFECSKATEQSDATNAHVGVQAVFRFANRGENVDKGQIFRINKHE